MSQKGQTFNSDRLGMRPDQEGEQPGKREKQKQENEYKKEKRILIIPKFRSFLSLQMAC
jgi:hypothetical protein